MTARTGVLAIAIVLLPSWTSAEGLTADRAVEMALAHNPEVAVLRSELEAFEARLSGASLLLQANPEISTSVGTRSAQTGDEVDYDVELTQQLEVFGQRGARIEAARAGRAGAEARLQARRSEVAAEVRQAFARSLAAEQLLVIARENLELGKQTAKAAVKRLEVGDASRIEFNTAHIEVGRAAKEVSMALKEDAAALASLRLLLALEPTIDLRLAGDLRVPTITTVGADALLKRAAESRADLVAARNAVEVARAERTVAKRDWLPRPRLGARYEQDEGDRVILGTLSFDLPLFNQNQAARGVAAAQLTQAERELQATERRVRQEVMLALSRISSAKEVVQAFEGSVIDAMTENLSLINTAYSAGKIDLFELLVIRRDTLEARRGYVEVLAELRAAEAELGKALGAEKGLP